MVAFIKKGGDETWLLVVDPDTDAHFKKRGVTPAAAHVTGTAWLLQDVNTQPAAGILAVYELPDGPSIANGSGSTRLNGSSSGPSTPSSRGNSMRVSAPDAASGL